MAAAAGVGLLDRDRPRRLAGAGVGLPFRDAHGIAAQAVRRAETLSVDLAGLGLAELQAIEPRITAETLEVLSVERAVASRTSFGGTAPVRVRAAIATARERYL